MKQYKFLRNGFRSENGDITWELNKWMVHEGELKMCESGFHCSKKIYQAFSYIQGEILTEVEVSGESIKEDDKEVWSEMRVVKAWKWTKKDSVALAIYAAGLVLDIYENEYPNDKRPREAIQAARKWLRNPTKENAEAAGAAAGAAWDAAGAAGGAARDVAWAAAGAAAWAARAAAWAAWDAAGAAGAVAWAAAESVAWAAGAAAEAADEDAFIKKISNWMDRRKYKLEKIS